MQDLLIVLILLSCALVPWMLPTPAHWRVRPPNRAAAGLAGHTQRPEVQYVRQARGTRRRG
jgi:hypothetical protein